ncbi:MAG: hypothetical protein ACAH80_05500 [Alphaproteobacteria bacterium]
MGSGFFTSVKQLFTPPPPPRPTVLVEKVCINKPCSPEKIAKLERLCAELCKREDMITSGRLQLLGFSEMKDRMGPRWEIVKSLVQNVTEEALSSSLGPNDVYMRLRDDAYIIVFGKAGVEEGSARAAQISRHIRQQLSSIGAALQAIDVRRQLCETRAADIAGKTEAELAEIFDKAKATHSAQAACPAEAPAPPATDFACSFVPLWEVQKGAITTYICEPDSVAPQGLGADMQILGKVMAELEAMAIDGRKFCIICPVSYDTLFHRGSFDSFTARIRALSPQQRALLVLKVHGFTDELRPNGCWFLAELKSMCRGVFAEVDPAHKKLLASFARYKFDGIGCRIVQGKQAEAFGMLGACALSASSLGVHKTFALGVDTLSLATVSVCHGFSFLGGMAVDGAVKTPDTLYRYGNLDLLSKIVQ